ncbi:hypothetical protein SLEP1_g36595 [Rubroshorea leprosula]|uniref:Uncharacterized protein n=1 Tax=Rubroshorea leprosula TaxID=152421 RepID=A0AAV5KS51_9ROSI|nr:hypothetical protein SLEP1_g36595 [Rubroshorea leprosula]
MSWYSWPIVQLLQPFNLYIGHNRPKFPARAHFCSPSPSFLPLSDCAFFCTSCLYLPILPCDSCVIM